MKHARQIRRITRDQTQRALLVQCLEAVEQLSGDFKIDIDAETDPNELINLARSADGERARTDLRQREIRFFPNRQTALVPSMKFLVSPSRANDRRDVASIFDQDEFANG